MWVITVAIVLSFALGVIMTLIGTRLRSAGDLKILHDPYDPSDGPYLFLELSSEPWVVQRKKYVTLKVKVDSGLSQK